MHYKAGSLGDTARTLSDSIELPQVCAAEGQGHALQISAKLVPSPRALAPWPKSSTGDGLNLASQTK